jgi:hypothetical protein
MQSDDKIMGNDKASARRLTMNQQTGAKSAVCFAEGLKKTTLCLFGSQGD